MGDRARRLREGAALGDEADATGDRVPLQVRVGGGRGLRKPQITDPGGAPEDEVARHGGCEENQEIHLSVVVAGVRPPVGAVAVEAGEIQIFVHLAQDLPHEVPIPPDLPGTGRRVIDGLPGGEVAPWRHEPPEGETPEGHLPVEVADAAGTVQIEEGVGPGRHAESCWPWKPVKTTSAVVSGPGLAAALARGGGIDPAGFEAAIRASAQMGGGAVVWVETARRPASSQGDPRRPLQPGMSPMRPARINRVAVGGPPPAQGTMDGERPPAMRGPVAWRKSKGLPEGTWKGGP